MDNVIITIREAVTQGLPNLLGALLILLVGLIIALVLRALIFAVLDRVRVDERIDRAMDGTPESFNIRNFLGQVVFWLVILFALVAALDVLQLDAIAEPINIIFARFLGFIPNLFSALILAALAWIVATVLSNILRRVLAATNLDERLTRSAHMDQRIPLSKSLVTLVYWAIWFLFLPAILDALNMEGVLRPVESLLQNVLAFLPNLFSALVILIVGYFAARIVRDIVTNLLASTGLDSLGERFGFAAPSTVAPTVPSPQTGVDSDLESSTETVVTEPDSMSLSRVIGLIVYILILIPVAIAALDVLQLDAISIPAIDMLQAVLSAIPAIFAAGLLLALAYFVAQFVGNLVTQLLAGVGFDRFLNRLGVTAVLPGSRQPSEIAGTLVTIAIMLFAATEAADLLGFDEVSVMIANFLSFFGDVVLGLVVLALGLYLANLAEETIRSSGMRNRGLLATFARYAILLLALTMALRQMGVAEDIITLAFGLLLGSVAVAAAIAFGWGGRELAREQLEKLEANLQERVEEPPAPSLPPTQTPPAP